MGKSYRRKKSMQCGKKDLAKRPQCRHCWSVSTNHQPIKKMTTTIITIANGFAVQNSNGTFVGFAATLEIAQGIKANADEASRIAADLEQQGYTLGW